jgi:CheY-like chemotaxis protein
MAALGPLLADHAMAPAVHHGAESQTRAGVIKPALRAPRTPCTLLTVDDGPMNVEYKRSLLEPAGYRVLGAGGVHSALALLRQETVDLVLSDVNMADGGGFELIRCLRASARWRTLPFIFLTSSARDSASREHGLQLGADNYLVRPLDADLLLSAVRDCLTTGR